MYNKKHSALYLHFLQKYVNKLNYGLLFQLKVSFKNIFIKKIFLYKNYNK